MSVTWICEKLENQVQSKTWESGTEDVDNREGIFKGKMAGRIELA